MNTTAISEQLLTDYALNELGPEERIYMESLLGASEDARKDIYQMIDLAILLDEGFQQAEDLEPMTLSAEQRGALLQQRMPNVFLHRAVVALAAAAALTLAVIHHDSWMPRVKFSSPSVAVATSGAPGMQAASGGETDYVNQLLQLPEWVRDPLLRKWFSTNLSEMFSEPVVSFEGMPSMPLDLMP